MFQGLVWMPLYYTLVWSAWIGAGFAFVGWYQLPWHRWRPRPTLAISSLTGAVMTSFAGYLTIDVLVSAYRIDGQICGVPLRQAITAASSGLSIFLLSVAAVTSFRDHSAARTTVKLASIVLLAIDLIGSGVFAVLMYKSQ